MEEHLKKYVVAEGALAEHRHQVEAHGAAYTDPIALFGMCLEQYAHFLVCPFFVLFVRLIKDPLFGCYSQLLDWLSSWRHYLPFSFMSSSHCFVNPYCAPLIFDLEERKEMQAHKWHEYGDRWDNEYDEYRCKSNFWEVINILQVNYRGEDRLPECEEYMDEVLKVYLHLGFILKSELGREVSDAILRCSWYTRAVKDHVFDVFNS